MRDIFLGDNVRNGSTSAMSPSLPPLNDYHFLLVFEFFCLVHNCYQIKLEVFKPLKCHSDSYSLFVYKYLLINSCKNTKYKQVSDNKGPR